MNTFPMARIDEYGKIYFEQYNAVAIHHGGESMVTDQDLYLFMWIENHRKDE